MAIRYRASRKTLASLKETSSRVLWIRGIQTFTLPDLPYDYGALEPAINGEIMKIHHQKHHQIYVTNYNNALKQFDQAVNKGDTSTVVKLQSAIKFNGGVFEDAVYSEKLSQRFDLINDTLRDNYAKLNSKTPVEKNVEVETVTNKGRSKMATMGARKETKGSISVSEARWYLILEHKHGLNRSTIQSLINGGHGGWAHNRV